MTTFESHAVFTTNYFSNNLAYGHGACAVIVSAMVEFINNVFVNHQAWEGGAPFFFDKVYHSHEPSFIDNIYSNNIAAYGINEDYATSAHSLKVIEAPIGYQQSSFELTPFPRLVLLDARNHIIISDSTSKILASVMAVGSTVTTPVLSGLTVVTLDAGYANFGYEGGADLTIIADPGSYNITYVSFHLFFDKRWFCFTVLYCINHVISFHIPCFVNE
jgi:hypothetical protein